MSGINDPFHKLKPGEPFVPVAAQFNMFVEDAQARRTQGQRIDSTSAISQAASLPVTVRNDLAVDLPAFSVIRWQGGPVKSATISGNVPELQLKTALYSETTKPIGVVGPQKIRKAAGGVTAGSGLVSILGVTWARCFGPIADGDAIEPNSSYVGVKSSIATPVIARGVLVTGFHGIIPVFVGAGGGATCSTKWQVFSLFGATGGTITLSIGVKNSGGTIVTEYVTINWNDSSAAIKAAFVTHSLLDSSDVFVSSGLDLVNNFTVTLPAGSVISGFTNGLISNKLVLPEVMVTSCCT